jgi:two-component system, chemotaxis family, chemotaxis protein CheY
MKTLIVVDDIASRKLLQSILSACSICDIAINGIEAVEAFKSALDEDLPYDLICMDIMMPNMDGHEALTKIKDIEKEHGISSDEEVKVIMTTVLGDPRNVFQAVNKEGAIAYLAKPIGKQKVLDEIKKLGLLETLSAIHI